MSTHLPAPSISILHQEQTWFVIAKPSGIHTIAQAPKADKRKGDEVAVDDVQPDGVDARKPEPSVESWLRAARPDLADLDEAGLVHRLDFDTSGCVIVAKTRKARERLRDAFSGRGGDIRKIYLARLEGCFASRVLSGSFTLSFSSRHKGSAKVSVHTRGEPETIGRCRWTVRSTTGNGAAATTLVEVELLGPGRRHQIRAGFAHEGNPLVGDTLYGAEPMGTDALPAQGICLHAWRVEVDGVMVECPLPAWV